MIRIKIPYLITVAAAILILVLGHEIAVNDGVNFFNYPQEIVKAKVLRITDRISLDEGFDEPVPMLGEKIYFEAAITSGTQKGDIVRASQNTSGFLQDVQKEVSVNSGILLIYSNNEWFFNGFLRINRMLGLAILFILCVILFGGIKGFNTILSLGFTCTAIFAVFIPAILSGKNIYVMSILVCIYTMVFTPLIVIGYNRKSLASITGCTGGVMISGIIALVMDKLLYLTGIVDEHSRYLVNLPGEIQLNLHAVVFAGIIIGAMGAVMDVAISLSSSLWEIKEKAPSITFKEMFRSGLTIGRDIMGTMADTLILAYIGSSLTVVILLSVFSGSFLGLFNSEMIAVEILQALAGSFGILFAMPLTALFCPVIYLRDKT
ncbi:MAG: YibE/F family protein [Treponema sp.]|nr:YibE/F family protein [Treponema sp.]